MCPHINGNDPTCAVSPCGGCGTENSRREMMNGKPVLYHECKSVLTQSEAFAHKLLSTGPVLNFGEACCYWCVYCYVESEACKRIHETLNGSKHTDVIVRRICGDKDGLAMLESNLGEWSRDEKGAKHVCFTATHVDPAANMDLVRETAAGITRIFEETNWEVRILSKSNLLPQLVGLIPEKYHQRLILGVSTGTLDDDLAKALEIGAPLVSKRLESLRWLQDNGFRTFGMICPSLPQKDYGEFSEAICEAIRVDRCEHVWAEPINGRGKNIAATVSALSEAGYHWEADEIGRIFASGARAEWDNYAKATFTAHAKNVPPEKLRFLHYPTQDSLAWWQEHTGQGAVLLGAGALNAEQKQAEQPDKAGPIVVAGHLAEALRKSIVPCTELSNLGIPKRRKVLGEWFMEGDYGIIYAERGLGKTWMVLGMATAMAGGSACGPWKANGSWKTLYVDGEMPVESIDQRIQGMGASHELMVLNHEALFHLGNETINLAQPSAQEALTDYILEHKVQVLVLDNLSCLFSGVKENEGDAWEPIKRWFLKLRRQRISVILVHHAGKNGEMRGTSKREDDVFWTIRLEETSEELQDGAQFISKFTKDRNSQREQTPLEWRFLTTADGKVQIQAQSVASLAAFRELVEGGETSATSIAAKLGVTKGTVSKWAKQADKDGWMNIERGKYTMKRAA